MARIGLLLLAMAILLLPSPAGAQRPQCGPRDMILDILKRRYDQEPVAIGVTHTGSLLEVVASPGGGSWTIIITVPGGPTCLVSSGEGWRGSPIDDPEA